MQTLNYPNGWNMHTGFYHDGKFYVVLRDVDLRQRWTNILPTWMLRSFDGTDSRQVRTQVCESRNEDHPYDFHIDPTFIAHPDLPGVSAIFLGEKENKVEATSLETGKKKKIYEGEIPQRWWDRRVWMHKTFKVLTHERTANVRAVWNDSLVVMTGKEAVSHASMIMGPTAAASVLATKGLENGHVVAYQRGGSHRVLKASRHKLTHLALADDGLVFMCCTTRNGAFLFDFDVR